MALKLIRSLWGCVQHPGFAVLRSTSAQLDLLHSIGYDGIEGSLTDIGRTRAERSNFIKELRERDMVLVLGLYSSWQDYEDWSDLHTSPAVQWDMLQRQIEEAAALDAGDVLIQINAHSGSDSWSETEAEQYFARATDVVIDTPLSHETHRGRVLGNPFTAHRLCERFEKLRLTLDLSHWIVVCERLLASESNPHELEVLATLLERVDHVKASSADLVDSQLVCV